MISAVTTLGERIQAALEAKQWRPNRLAAELDVDTDTVRRWLRDLNKPRVDDVAPLADRLGVSISWLLTGQDEGFDPATLVSVWFGLQAAWDRLAALQLAEMTDEVRAQIVETQEVIVVSQQMLGLTAAQAAAFAEAADAIAGADALRADAHEEDDPPLGEDDSEQRPSA